MCQLPSRVLSHTSHLLASDVDATCSDFDFGTALHIAASNLCMGAMKSLLEHGANPAFRNEKGQVPADVVPDPVDMPLEMADAAAVAKELKQMLLDAVPLACDISKVTPLNFDHVSGKAMLMSLGLKLGDRVSIAGQKIGTLRFCGPTEFASGQWAGIELDDPEGKNDGSVGGIQYFKCSLKHGIFAPLSKISKASDHKKNVSKSSSAQSTTSVRSQKIDFSHVASKINTGLMSSKTLGCPEPKAVSPSEEGAKSLTGRKAALPGSSCSSSSTSSLESKPSRYCRPHQWNATRSYKKAVLRPANSTLKSKSGLRNRTSSVGSVNSDEVDIKLGDRVLVVGQRTGVVRFNGKTSFAPGCWYGIELDKPHGKNDGSVGEVRYFTCPPKHGVFAPPSRVQRISGSLDSLSDIPSNKLSHSFPGKATEGKNKGREEN